MTMRSALLAFGIVGLAAGCSPVTAGPRPSVRAKEVPRVESLARDFAAFRARAESQPLATQVLAWDEAIEHPHRGLYDDVVWSHARGSSRSERSSAVLEGRLKAYAGKYDAIEAAFADFPVRARSAVERFGAHVAPLSPALSIVALASPTFDGKSAMLDGKVIVAVGMDTVVINQTNLDILLPHELFHAHHASQGLFVNDGLMPGASLAIPLWEEGLATYVSGVVAIDASDGELLLDPSLARVSSDDVRWLAAAVESELDALAADPGPTPAFKRWFSISPSRPREDLPNRCGYLLGLLVVRRVAKDFSLHDMIAWTPEVAAGRVRAALHELAVR